MIRFFFYFLFVLTAVSGSFAHSEESQIYIDVGQGSVKKSLIALPPLLYSGTQAANAQHIKVGQDLFRVIYNDFSVSGFFEFIKPEAYLENPAKVGLRPAPGTPGGFNFEKWKTIGTEFLVRAAYQVIGGELSMETYIYHVPTARLVLGKNYKGPTNATRKIAHTFANDVVKALTGKRGMFTTKLVASGRPPGGNKEIYVMDWDGANRQKISSHNSLAISPAWATGGDKIAYTGYPLHTKEKVRNADLFVYELATGKRYLVSYRKGINSGASFFPGDKYLLMTSSMHGNPDLYKMTSDGKSLTRLTKGPGRAMNVEAVPSPDGSKIAFSSDRAGQPHLYVMDADGSDVKRLTFAGKYNSTPSWSPDGKTLAFAGFDKDHFDVFTIGVDGKNLKRLTDANKKNGKAANNEGPSWSPDGRHIVFSSDRTGAYQIYVVSPDGTNERRITDDNYVWDKPKWSPFLD
ncbi:MAG: translocation protein TolB [Bdellovibrionales bacterium]